MKKFGFVGRAWGISVDGGGPSSQAAPRSNKAAIRAYFILTSIKGTRARQHVPSGWRIADKAASLERTTQANWHVVSQFDAAGSGRLDGPSGAGLFLAQPMCLENGEIVVTLSALPVSKQAV